jgi:DNA-binding response OmpR family regulator
VEFAFGDHVLDVDRRELRHRGEPIALEPQVFDLLAYLVRNRERVVSKDDLLQVIWGGRIVSESTMTSHTKPARKRRRGRRAMAEATREERKWGVARDMMLAAGRRFPVRIRIAFGPEGLGQCIFK